MYNLRAHGAARPPNDRSGRIKKDGWGNDLQTIYLKNPVSMGRGALPDREALKQYQLRWCDHMEEAYMKEYDYFRSNGWDNLEPIYNDPVSYSLEQVITDMRKHYAHNPAHDVTLSFILRQRYLIRRLAKELDSPGLIKTYDIKVDIVNPANGLLREYYRHGVFDEEENTFNDLFGN